MVLLHAGHWSRPSWKTSWALYSAHSFSLQMLPSRGLSLDLTYILRNVPFLPNLLVKLSRKMIHPAKILWCKFFNHLQSGDGFQTREKSINHLLSPQLSVGEVLERLANSHTSMRATTWQKDDAKQRLKATRCIKATCSPYVPRRYWNTHIGEGAQVCSIAQIT